MPAPARPGRVAVVGTLNVDLVWQVASLPAPGQTVLATATERQFGGKGANQAVAAARQGARVTLIGAVGDDAEGRAYCEHLLHERINPAHVAVVPGVSTGTAHVYVDARGENLIVVDQGANARLAVAGLGAVLPSIDVLLVQLECALPAAVEALRLAEAAGIPAVLNASPVNAAFPWGRHAIDTVIVNEHECAECFGHAPEALRVLSRSALNALLSARKVRHLVITQGAAPTLHFTTDTSHEVPTFPVQPRDTVGAGDTFAGTLAAQLAEGRDWPAALQHANIAGALSTLALGAQAAMPTRMQVDQAQTKNRAGFLSPP